MTITDSGRIQIETYLEICQFLYYEAELLDDRRFEEWLGLLTEDVKYRMPVRVTKEKADGSDIEEPSSYFEDDLVTLTSRVARLGTKSAWADDPPSRTRHFVSNILVQPGADSSEYLVTSALYFVRNRGSISVNDQLSGKRKDILRRVQGDLKIASRDVYLDQVVLPTPNLITLF